MVREIFETKRKALKINLNAEIYGTFAEIGAGQEVARNFFNAGAASGTIAKTMSAYDMTFSDAIYGEEEDGRYVSRTRLTKMLQHEFDLLTTRLHSEKYDNKKFFAFADTVTTLNFTKTNEPHGWIGLRFQHEVDGPVNDIIIHVRLLDSDNQLQQKVLGIIGVNLLFAAYYYADNAQIMIESLVDNLSIGSVEIDLVKVDGPLFKNVNERLINLYLIAKGFAKAAIFRPDGKAAQIKDYLYKKNIILLRTKYRQKSLPNFDLFNLAVDQFKKNTGATAENTVVLIEVLMGNVLEEDHIITASDLEEFAKRAEELCSTGNNIMVSNFRRNNHLAEFINNFKPMNIGIATNVSNLRNIFNSDNYNKEQYTNELLSYISGMFNKNIKLYAYPYLLKKDNKIITTKNMSVSEEARPLFDFLIKNGYIIDIENYDIKHVKTV
ncbi:nicotinamide mononucleotide adenylyltransferase [Sphingobacterium sp. SRCM116780]|uniref:nicotinamide mononucleotide adenylyltransferase n=1 Tax=Sphingobacterium sp. SRCM116780 TaxID=2907623 RepID=UPI001F469567|nr:nicotinamide mononucleotide adenylyltransferase [Sphingobacterium sp. SRCM116780]UIR55690.1 nicotinamide mononucleotide adenylyltransferase [Sphingobacterium sp. SRCM116780]